MGNEVIIHEKCVLGDGVQIQNKAKLQIFVRTSTVTTKQHKNIVCNNSNVIADPPPFVMSLKDSAFLVRQRRL